MERTSTPTCPKCNGHNVKRFTAYGVKGSGNDKVKTKESKTWHCLGCKHKWPATE